MKRFCIIILLLWQGVAFADDAEWEKNLAEYERGHSAYYYGNYEKAFEILKPLAEQGFHFAFLELGILYYRGQGVPQDYKEAAKWFRLGAEDDPYARNNLGGMYLLGEGVPQSYVHAYVWLSIAHKYDSSNKLLKQAMENISPDELEEAKLLLKQCIKSNNKNCDSIKSFSSEFLKGLDAFKVQNYSEAFEIWKPLAEQGDLDAQFQLGRLYHRGRGVSQNHSKAIEWYEKSAKQGNFDAQYHLGEVYLFGDSAIRNYVNAYMWLRTAFHNTRNSATASLARVADKKLTPAQSEEAERLANQCRHSNYKNCE